MAEEKYEIIGPCSKNIPGKGWVTEVYEYQLNAIGFYKAKPEPEKEAENKEIKTKK